LKVMQMNPAVGIPFDVEVELITPNVGTWSNWNCTSIDYFFKRGEELRMYDFCWRMEGPLIQLLSQFFDASIRCMPLKLIPPRVEGQPDCKWVHWIGDIKAGDRTGYAAARKREAEAEGVPTDLKDYRGPLHARMKMGNFCKETVAKMLVQISRLYRIMDGQWRNLIVEKHGEEAAWDRQAKVWEDAAMINSRYVAKAFNIQGTPLERCLKVLQVNPAFGLLNSSTYELKSPDTGVVTIYRCPTREYFERLGGMVNLSHICGDMEPQLFQNFARVFDPEIKVKPLKVPALERRADPRMLINLDDRLGPKNEAEPVCQWEFRI
ncbi:hypothetical protein ACFLX5_02610, partial [Chloroflexota bacterium]